MTKIRFLPALSLTLALLAVPADAAEQVTSANTATTTDTNLEILRETIRANKKALVAASLDLTEEQAQKFWPIYGRYQKDLTAINDRYVRILEEYEGSFANLSDEKAMQLISDYLTAETDRIILRREYLPQFAEAVPGIDVARFYQIENKMEAVIRHDLAGRIPVVKR
jgi:Spy/CpxP family protein refolding chaperone